MKTKQLRNKKICLAFFIFIVLILCSNVFIVQAQSDGQTLLGKTKKVSIFPYQSADAGIAVFKADTDHDGMSDEYETDTGLDPNNATDADSDLDGDGLSNLDEFVAGTNARVPDTDGDGFSDFIEVQQGYDPLDANSHPPAGRTLVNIQVNPQNIGLSLNSLLGIATSQLTVTGFFSDNTTGDITKVPGTLYQSGDPNIAFVNSSGIIIANSTGTTTIVISNGTIVSQVNVSVTSFSPTSIATIKVSGFANRVFVSNNFAYLANGTAGLQIIDVSIPEQPIVRSKLPLSGNANDIKVIGNFAYLACGNGGLQIVDVTDPLNPIVVGSTSLDGEAIDVSINGNFAYIAAGNGGLSIIDVTEPTFPFVVTSISFIGTSIGVSLDVERGLAVLLTKTGLLQVIDISISNSPQLLGSLNIPGNYSDVAISNQIAYLAEDNNIIAVKISNPANLELIGDISNVPFPARDVVVNNNILFSAVAFQGNGSVPLFRLNDSNQPSFLGAIPLNTSYSTGIGITATESLIFLTSSGQISSNNRNGTTGDTSLQILRYSRSDTASIDPTVNIVSPSANTVLVPGEQITIKVVATDDIAVAGVEIKVNGIVIANLTSPPYETPFVVSNSGNIVLEAKAVDTANNTGISPIITLPIGSDPGTTVTGRVTDLRGNSIEGATVTLEDGSNRTATTDFDGKFTFSGVSTVPLGVSIFVSAVDGQSREGRSANLPTIRGGITDLGIIAIANSKTTALPTTPSALGVGNYDGNQYSDLFIGFNDQQSQIYLSTENGGFNPSSNYILPFGAVKAGDSVDLNIDGFADVLAQPLGQLANATVVFSDGNGGISAFSNFATGLSGESDFITTGKDSNDNLVIGFLSNTDSTSLQIRFGDGNSNFTDPMLVAVDPNIPLRTLKITDINGDGLADIVVLKDLAGNLATLVAYLRTGTNSFGSAVESTVIIRTNTSTMGSVDYALGDFNFDSIQDVAVLGDDRVRIYQGDGNGVFIASSEVGIKAGNKPMGIGIANFSGNDGIVVNVANEANSARRSILIYVNMGGEFFNPTEFLYQNTQPLVDSRIIVGNFADAPSSPDVVLVEGKVIRSLTDIFFEEVSSEPPPIELLTISSKQLSENLQRFFSNIRSKVFLRILLMKQI